MASSLSTHAQDLAEHLNDSFLTGEELTSTDILDALASLGIALVEDLIGDSTFAYQEEFRETRPGTDA